MVLTLLKNYQYFLCSQLNWEIFDLKILLNYNTIHYTIKIRIFQNYRIKIFHKNVNNFAKFFKKYFHVNFLNFLENSLIEEMSGKNRAFKKFEKTCYKKARNIIRFTFHSLTFHSASSNTNEWTKSLHINESQVRLLLVGLLLIYYFLHSRNSEK